MLCVVQRNDQAESFPAALGLRCRGNLQPGPSGEARLSSRNSLHEDDGDK